MIRVHFDFETFSECDIRKAGAWAYAIHPSTRILCMGYAYEDEAPQLWTPDQEIPDFMRDDCIGDYDLHAWNSFFEWVIWEHAMKTHHCYTPPLEYWHDTAALASVMALPRALGNCGKALGMPSNVSKDKRGYELIKLLSIPNKMNGDPKLTKEMHDYCLQDVVAERALAKKLWDLNSTERKVWVLDQKINIKGIAVDIPRVDDAIDVYEKAFVDIKDRLIDITGLANPNSQKQFFDWMLDKGHKIPDITKGTLSALLEEPDAFGTHEAVNLRMKLAKTAPKKYASIRTRLGGGIRLHGNMMYHGASTGRWVSPGINLQNIARPTVDPDVCIPLLKHRDICVFKMHDLEPMDALSSSIRGMLIPSDGKKFITGDYSSIESRVLAWLAGQEDKLEVFRGHGKMYEYLASKIFRKDIDDVTKDERFVGKIGELACGYGGGAGALQGMAQVYRVPMSKNDAQRIKQQWRKANPQITQYWKDVEAGAVEAIHKGEVQDVRGIKFAVKNNFLVCQLPSGRRIFYHRPQLVKKKVIMYKTPETGDSPEMSYIYSPRDYDSLGAFEKEAKDANQETFEFLGVNIEFWGVNSQTKKWCLQSTYGGKLCLAGDTKVLTQRGWARIDEILPEDTVWDGTEWVAHGGRLNKGMCDTIELDGIRMTEDHKILTGEGWKSASSSEGHYWADVRLPNSAKLHWIGRGKITMDFFVPGVREGDDDERIRVFEEKNEVLRMYEGGAHCRSEKELRRPLEKSSPLQCVEVNDTKMFRTEGPVVGQLRGKRNNIFGAVGRFSGVSTGHGTELHRGSYTGQEEQQRRLQQIELPVGHNGSKLQQQEKQHPDNHPVGRENNIPSGEAVWSESEHSMLQDKSRRAGKIVIREGRRQEQVYDLMNTGPLNQFTVLGDNGPRIVHNCENITQAVARDIMAESMLALDDAGYEIVLTVHDEIISEVYIDDETRTVEKFTHLMEKAPGWAKGLPVRVEAYESRRYRK